MKDKCRTGGVLKIRKTVFPTFGNEDKFRLSHPSLAQRRTIRLCILLAERII